MFCICSLQFFTHRSHTLSLSQSHFSGQYSLRFKGFFSSKQLRLLAHIIYDIHAQICTVIFPQTQAFLHRFLNQPCFFSPWVTWLSSPQPFLRFLNNREYGTLFSFWRWCEKSKQTYPTDQNAGSDRKIVYIGLAFFLFKNRPLTLFK